MSKLSFLTLAAVVGLAAASCSKSASSVEPATAPVSVKVNEFSISMDPMQDTKVQDIGHQYSPVLAITLAFYDSAGAEVYKSTQLKSDATEQSPFGVFACNLPVGDLTMVVLGYGFLSGDVLVLNGPTSAGFTSDGGVRDTFCKVQSVTVSGSGSNAFTANLDRVTCKLILHSTDLKAADATQIRISASGSARFFNPNTGLAVNNEGFSFLKSAGTNGYVSTSISFLYLATDEQSLDITIEPLNADGEVLSSHVVQNVPFKRNYSTHLRGSLYNTGSSASGFTINESFGSPEYDISF